MFEFSHRLKRRLEDDLGASLCRGTADETLPVAFDAEDDRFSVDA
eukprot:CAMPEP_0202976444 /NCGR_PEP_ID=MMETSP1396-20130829/77378_1 /ASSEMBLY_ACC=CAM_ASM_000872 /TAXON_ID= /ORGANISM="Pseudokeronopsis sp., Strain Brazil" /LENGTH=44 /DNA_ID= /DNA_START= /DNA_END= /DNA_ORIENTATION=